MSKPWETDDDFAVYLNSGDPGTHPLVPTRWRDHRALGLQTRVGNSLVPIARLARDLAQYLLHPLVQ